MLLKVEDISKSYAAETILQNVSLEIQEKDAVAITGPSGCGKSTLLAILGLFLQPNSGQIYYNGQDVSILSDKERSQIRNREYGFIFQNTQLIPSLTVLDNVLLPSLLARQKGMVTRGKELLVAMGLAERLSYYPHQLSIGQRRRVSIARALLLEPKIVFADEPTNDLDPERAQWVSDFLLDLPNRGCALVLVSHDRNVVEKVSKKYHLEKGRLVLG